jgi:tRNA dimethylallyltransferase
MGVREPTPGPGTLIVVLGPTAVGKTALGVLLAGRFDGEIISADAMQVYRGFDAATAKPTPEERMARPHALVDVVDPRDDFNLGDFVRAAEREIDRIRNAGRRPVVVGGTGLYLRGLLKGVFPGPRRDPTLRQRLLERARGRRSDLLHRYLRRLDPLSAQRITHADRQRIVRALEVVLLTGRPLAEQWGEGWAAPDRFPAVKIGLTLPRAELYRRIDARVVRFFEGGLVEETRRLLSAGVPREANAFKGLGYRQVLDHLDGRSTLDETVALVQQATRRFAKRQYTWFRKERGVTWFDASGADYPRCVEADVARALMESCG